MNGDGSEAERGRTRPISGSLQPVWKNPAEVFILTAVEEIILEVRGECKKIEINKKHVSLGEAGAGNVCPY